MRQGFPGSRPQRSRWGLGYAIPRAWATLQRDVVGQLFRPLALLELANVVQGRVGDAARRLLALPPDFTLI